MNNLNKFIKKASTVSPEQANEMLETYYRESNPHKNEWFSKHTPEIVKALSKAKYKDPLVLTNPFESPEVKKHINKFRELEAKGLELTEKLKNDDLSQQVSQQKAKEQKNLENARILAVNLQRSLAESKGSGIKDVARAADRGLRDAAEEVAQNNGYVSPINKALLWAENNPELVGAGVGGIAGSALGSIIQRIATGKWGWSGAGIGGLAGAGLGAGAGYAYNKYGSTSYGLNKKFAKKVTVTEEALNEVLPSSSEYFGLDNLITTHRHGTRSGQARALAQAAGEDQKDLSFFVRYPLLSSIASTIAGGVAGGALGIAHGGRSSGRYSSDEAGAKGLFGAIVGMTIGAISANIIRNKNISNIKKRVINKQLDTAKITDEKPKKLNFGGNVENAGALATKYMLENQNKNKNMLEAYDQTLGSTGLHNALEYALYNVTPFGPFAAGPYANWNALKVQDRVRKNLNK